MAGGRSLYVVQQWLRGGLTDVDLLRTFVSRRVQPLCRWEMAMWMYLGPSCPNRLFSTKLDGTETNTQIQGVLAHGADQNIGSSPIPLREEVDRP
jgi:hypothetical protein